jgi:hypothetical protein
LTENFNSRGEMMGIDELEEIVRDASHLPLTETKLQILNRVAAWRDSPAADDVSLAAVELCSVCRDRRISDFSARSIIPESKIFCFSGDR